MNTLVKWDEMKYWNSPEWEAVQNSLDKLEKQHTGFNPARENLFAALDATPWHLVKVAILGQDPYPDPTYATGVAFSIPPKLEHFPKTLDIMFKELERDLKVPYPKSGDLTKWTEQGVLLWNVIPSCTQWDSSSHDWDEWAPLTQEIIELLDETEGVVFAFLGAKAKRFVPYVTKCPVVGVPHPAARDNSFLGCRLFSTINTKLSEVVQSPIDWRL
jgi:uracil-DNA glycosylase